MRLNNCCDLQLIVLSEIDDKRERNHHNPKGMQEEEKVWEIRWEG